MSNPVIYWAVGGLLILFFCYLTYKFTKTWRIWHVMFAFCVFGGAMALCVFAAAALRTHNAWRSIVTKQSEDVQKLTAERDLLRYGNLLERKQTVPSIRELTAALGRVVIDRGRVWRGCTPAQPGADDTVTVSTAAVGAAAATPNHMDQNTIFNVFIELDAPAEEKLPAGSRVPAQYIGEFAATAVTDTSVTLKPTSPLDEVGKALLRRQGVSWAIYETMPVDGHEWFADPSKEPDWNQTADESPIFGSIDKAAMERMIPPPQRQGVASDDAFKQLQDRYNALLAPYLRDGRRASEDDPPGNVWLKVRFTQPHKEDVDTAGDPVGAVKSSQDFFNQGRAEVALLRRGKQVEFAVGDVAILPQDDAQRLIDQEKVCTLIERVYVRTLHDYEAGFRNITQHLTRLSQDIAGVQRESAEITQANEMVLAQIKQCEDTRTKLKEDLQKTERERDMVTKYAAALQTKWAQMREELSLLYRTNSQLAEQLTALDQQMTDEANRRVADAVRGVE